MKEAIRQPSVDERSDDMSFGQERRKMPDPSMMALQLTNLQTDMADLKTSTNALTEAVARLSVIEERQANNQADTNRAFNRLERIEDKYTHKQDELEARVKAIEVQIPVLAAQSDNSSKWIAHALTALTAAAFVFVGIQTGLLPSGAG